MTTPNTNVSREDLLDSLAQIVDGDEGVVDRFVDLLATDEDLSDLVHEAGLTADAVEDAGADFVVPEDFEARVLAAIDSADAGPTTVTSANQSANHSANQSANDAAHDTVNADVTLDGDGAPDIVATPADVSGSRSARRESPAHDARTENETRVAKAEPTKSRALLPWIAGGSFLALAAAAVLGIIAYGASRGASPVANTSDLTATITEIAGPSLSVQPAGESGFSPRDVGATLNAGDVVQTDSRTRVLLSMSDGSELTLNQGTRLRMVGDVARSVRLEAGELLADIAHLDQGPNARLETPSGLVEVLGTKFVLTASEDRTNVRVTRGVVRLHGATESQEVQRGQEGIVGKGENPRVLAASGLAGSMSWSELRPGVETDDDVPVPGIGELRARRPGEREEQERPLTLSNHKVNVRIVGNVARTEIEETFQNDSAQTLEGVYRFPLPPDARIASLSLEVDGRWETGAFVAKDRAQQIWRGVIRNATPERQREQEEFIWVPGPWRDPALLEWQRGGRFELRIFPIPGNGARRIKLAYEQTIAPQGESRRYVYPLAHSTDGSTRVGHFEVDVRVAGADTVVKSSGYDMNATQETNAQRRGLVLEDFQPAGDLVIDYKLARDDAEMRWWTFRGSATVPPPADSREGDAAALAAQRSIHEDDRPYVVFALRPEIGAATQTEPSDYVFLLDSSQSMVGARFDRASRVVSQMVSELDRRDRFSVMACDLECQAMTSEMVAPDPAQAGLVRDWLTKIEPAGSSDLMMALTRAAASARQGHKLHVIYLGDGLSSTGPRRPASVAAVAAEIASADNVTLSTVGIGQDADTVALSAVSRAGGGHYVPFVPGQRASEAALAVLETTYGPSVANVSIQMPEGVTDIAPAQLPTLRAGQELLVVGRLATGAQTLEGEVVLRGKSAGEAFEGRYPVQMRVSENAGNAFVPRTWASKTIEELELGGSSDDVPRIVALSKAFGVMSRETSLLVLESEAMFRAFNVDRARPAIEWTGDEDVEAGESNSTTRAQPRRTRRARRGRGAPASLGSGFSGLDDRPAQSARRPAAADSAVAESDVRPRIQRLERPRPRIPPGGGGGRFMRKVWFREGSISRSGDVRPRENRSVTQAEARLRENADSRDRHRDLVRALSRAGQLQRAEEVAKQWLERDPLDPEALTYLSDVVGRRGDRGRALRLLSGIVDLEPENEQLQERLADAMARGDRRQHACAHRVALAEIKRDGDEARARNDRGRARSRRSRAPEANATVDAIRCSRALGQSKVVEALLNSVPHEQRALVEGQSYDAPSEPRRGERVSLNARWFTGDLDLSIITPQGTRLSWMGGRRSVSGESAMSPSLEELTLRTASPGTYYIEVNRPTAGSGAARGEIRASVYGTSSTIPFEFTGERAIVGRFTVARRWRLQ